MGSLVYLQSSVALDARRFVVHRDDGDTDGQGRTLADDVKSRRHKSETVLCGLTAVVVVVHLSLLYLRIHNRYQKSTHTYLILFLTTGAVQVFTLALFCHFPSEKSMMISF